MQTGSTQRQVCRRLEVSAEGTGNTRLPQGRIDTTFRRPSTQLAQTDNASEAVRPEVEGSSKCFDDVTDTTWENGWPHKRRSV